MGIIPPHAEIILVYLIDPRNLAIKGHAVAHLGKTIEKIRGKEPFLTSRAIDREILGVWVPEKGYLTQIYSQRTVFYQCALCGGPIDNAAFLNCQFCGASPEAFFKRDINLCFESLGTPLPAMIVAALKASGYWFAGSPTKNLEIEEENRSSYNNAVDRYNMEIVRAPSAISFRIALAKYAV